MTAEELETFLQKTGQAILLRTNADGTANGAALWFDWDGASVNAETAEFIGVPTGTPGAADGDILGLVRPGRYALPLLDAAERAG